MGSYRFYMGMDVQEYIIRMEYRAGSSEPAFLTPYAVQAEYQEEKMSIFKGAGVALVTPMKENQEVDYEKLEELIEWQIAEGTDCIVIAGTTGESSTLTTEEHAKVIKAAVDFTKHRIPVVAGTGSNCTETAVYLSREAASYGVDALLQVTPYYNKATQKGLYQHFKAIAQASPLPIVLYNVPGRTGINMKAETTVRLAKDFPNIVGVKEASGSK